MIKPKLIAQDAGKSKICAPSKPKIIAQGAEAKIILSKNIIIKDRISKSYRILELDKKIRKSRTKAEIKLLNKASKIINAPVPLTNKNSKDIFQIKIPYIKGKKLSQYLDKFPLKQQKQICKQIGKDVSKLHNENIIHGDLTTSNMILIEKQRNLPDYSHSQINKINIIKKYKQGALTKSGSEQLISKQIKPIIFFIDFGLGFISHKFEDKAVDIHLFKQALEAKHFKNWEGLFKEFEKAYKTSNDSKIVLERLKAVEKRGRYKH